MQSVNGPWVTTIQGAGATNGPNAVRCAWLTNNASLIGFKLSGGATTTSGNSYGGGVYGTSSNLSVVANCVVMSNTAFTYGAAAYLVTLNNCLIATNSPGPGGAYRCLLRNCTVAYNSSPAVYNCTATNCIIYYNSQNNLNSVLAYCCVTPLASGPGNFSTAPQLFADGIHLSYGSPCIGAGTNVATGTDIFGNAWSSPPSIGCAEFQQSPVVANPHRTLTNSPIGFQISAAATGLPPLTYSWLKDGNPLVDDGHFTATQTTNLVIYGVKQTDVGNYQLVVGNASGTVTSAVASVVAHYVDAAATNATSPYTSWATAASTIQDAIDAANANEIIFVTNGLYTTGGKAMSDGITNRVTIDKSLIVQSVNGPFETTIQGAGATNGPNAMRCAYVNYNGRLIGFTLEDGATRTGVSAAAEGGGVYGTSPSGSKAVEALVANCVIVSNTAYEYGAAAYNVLLDNCAIANNSTAPVVFSCGLLNCTVISNSTVALRACMATNCIVQNNTSNYFASSFFYSCTTPFSSGTGNFTNSPGLFADGLHLSTGSPCIAAGTNIATGTDIFGNAWSNPPSVGCAEWIPQPVILPQLTVTAVAPGRITINVTATGQMPLTCFWFQNGNSVQDGDLFSNTSSTNLILKSPDCTGSYQVIVSNAFGVATSAVTQVVIRGVDANGSSPTSPYTSWSTAATTIQDAIDAANSGDFIMVTNGLYATGGRTVDGILTNRVTVDKPVTLLSVSGPASTAIQGAWDPMASTNWPGVGTGPLAIRCVWLTNGATLMGFTLQNGATRSSGATEAQTCGGGVYCVSSTSTVANCVLTNNCANKGGGVANGTLINSYLTQNVAGAYNGGGAYNSTVRNCTIINNYSTWPSTGSSGMGGGIYGGLAYNSIITGNYDDYPVGGQTQDNYGADYSPITMFYCCTYPLPSGTGNISSVTYPPIFVDAFHICATSPCRGAGNIVYASGTDLDGEPWSNPPSIGCDEVIDANLVGPLSVNLIAPAGTNGVVGKFVAFDGFVSGKVSRVGWAFENGPIVTNANWWYYNKWTNPGTYNVSFTAYNADNPSGVSTNLTVLISPIAQPILQSTLLTNNTIQITFPTQRSVLYTVFGTTNLIPPITWTTLSSFGGSGSDMQFTDTAATNFPTRFYQVQAQ